MENIDEILRSSNDNDYTPEADDVWKEEVEITEESDDPFYRSLADY